MSDTTFQMSIPLDEDGFIEMECDYCQNRFMLHKDVYESEENLSFFCPICGLPSSTSDYLCSEVIEKAQQIAVNYMYDMINRQLGKSFKSKYVSVKTNKLKKEPEKELYVPINNYSLIHNQCCNVDIKVTEFDNEVGTYCPICGGFKS